MSAQLDSTNETIAATAANGVPRRPRRIRKTTKFYTPAQSITKKRQRKVAIKPKKSRKNEEPVTTGGKRKASDVPAEQPKKIKVSESAGSKRKLNPDDETEKPRKKADLITVRPVQGRKHLQKGRCFSAKYNGFEKCTACKYC